MAEFRFTNDHSSSDLGHVADVLLRPRLWIPTESDYPTHGDWVQKTEAQLAADSKRAMMAYYGPVSVGTVVYQQHKTRPEAVEIKNISVSDDMRGRYVGSFLLRNAEIEAITTDFPDCTTVVGDTKITNVDMIKFVLDHGYTVEEITDLYGLGTGLDVVFSKSITK